MLKKLLVKGGFPYVVNYLRHKRFSPTHQREYRTLKQISRNFHGSKYASENYKFEECIRTEEKQSCGQINQSLGQAAGFRTGHRPLIGHKVSYNLKLPRSECLVASYHMFDVKSREKQQEVLVYDEQGNLSKTTAINGSGYGRM